MLFAGKLSISPPRAFVGVLLAFSETVTERCILAYKQRNQGTGNNAAEEGHYGRWLQESLLVFTQQFESDTWSDSVLRVNMQSSRSVNRYELN